MVKKVRSIKTPNFLAKNFLLIIISGSLVLFLLLKVKPDAFYVILAFLFLLFLFISNLISFLWFLIWYRQEIRVWYLKDDAFFAIHKRSVYIALSICLSMLLKYLGQLNGITFLVLVILLLIFYFIGEKSDKF